MPADLMTTEQLRQMLEGRVDDGAPIFARFLSDPKVVPVLRQAVERLCQANGFDERASGEVGLALNEALANVIRHAYDGREDAAVEFSCRLHEDKVVLELRDWATPPDPSVGQKIDSAKPHDPDDVRPGGLGLLCLKETMDHFDYEVFVDGARLRMERLKDRRGEPA